MYREDHEDPSTGTGNTQKLQEKYKARHDQHKTKKSFKTGDRVWLQLNNERLQGPSKKINALSYGPFEILEKVGDNSYRLSLPPYMNIYSVVNETKLKLYEPSMLDQEDPSKSTRNTIEVVGEL